MGKNGEGADVEIRLHCHYAFGGGLDGGVAIEFAFLRIVQYIVVPA